MDASPMATLAEIAKVEAAKAAPFAGTLIVYGLTLQQWTLLFGCLYAMGLLVDLVVRRWLIPLVRLVRSERKAAEGSAP